jgi:hypothetical protein
MDSSEFPAPKETNDAMGISQTMRRGQTFVMSDCRASEPENINVTWPLTRRQLFDEIKDYPAGFRVLGLPYAAYRRVALAFGLPPEKNKFELVRLLMNPCHKDDR